MSDWPPKGIEWFYADDYACIAKGDCRDILPLLPRADCVITDPPYPNGEGLFLDGIPAARWAIKNADCGRKFIFWSELETPSTGLAHVATHIWHRTNVNGKIYEPCYEFAEDGVKRRSEIFPGAAIFKGAGAGCCEYLGHPTQKPIHVMRQLLALRYPETVLDPFAGVGTTLVAAKQLGRRAIGIEIEEKYCEIAANRLRNESNPLIVEQQSTHSQQNLI